MLSGLWYFTCLYRQIHNLWFWRQPRWRYKVWQIVLYQILLYFYLVMRHYVPWMTRRKVLIAFHFYVELRRFHVLGKWEIRVWHNLAWDFIYKAIAFLVFHYNVFFWLRIRLPTNCLANYNLHLFTRWIASFVGWYIRSSLTAWMWK